jgi:glycosyltransferase involved in cell wall biosynthesis
LSKRPSISVVIPYKDRPEQLERALRSVSSQTVLPEEVIIIDDGSLIPLELKGNYQIPARVVRQSNRGPAAARNLGIREAACDWIALLDSDDTWLPEKLETQVRLIEQHKDAGFVVCDMLTHGRAPVQFPLVPVDGSTEGVVPDALERLLPGRYIHTSGVLFKKQVFEQVGGFDESMWYCEDRDLWLRLAAATRVVVTTRQLSEYFREDEGLSVHEDTPLEGLAGIYIFDKMLASNLFDEATKRQAAALKAKTLHALAYTYRKRGQALKCCAASVRSIRQGGPFVANLKNMIYCWPEKVLGLAGSRRRQRAAAMGSEHLARVTSK